MRGKTADVGAEDELNDGMNEDEMEDVEFFEEELDDDMEPDEFAPDPFEESGPNTREQFEEEREDDFLFEE